MFSRNSPPWGLNQCRRERKRCLRLFFCEPLRFLPQSTLGTQRKRKQFIDVLQSICVNLRVSADDYSVSADFADLRRKLVDTILDGGLFKIGRRFQPLFGKRFPPKTARERLPAKDLLATISLQQQAVHRFQFPVQTEAR